MKVAIIGAGAVGAACLTAFVLRGCAREIVILDRDRKKAQGLVADVQYGAVLSPAVALREGDYADLIGVSLILITAGVNEKSGGATDRSDPTGRLRLLDTNIDVYKDIVPRLHAVAPEAMVLVVTDPPDPLADAVRVLGHSRVLSTGTYLDSLRFKFHLARRLGVRPASVDALILGEHGTSEVFVWSSARVAGVPVSRLVAQSGETNFDIFCRDVETEVRYANITIIEGIGASQHGIGMAAARIAEIILRDEKTVIPVGCYNPHYGVTLSLPGILGRDGVQQIFEPDMSENERRALQRSADTLKAAAGRIKV
jgi:L-lactate dehydrogenase